MDFSYGMFQLFSQIECRFSALQQAVAGYLLDVNLRLVPNNPPSGAVVVEDLQIAISTGEPRRVIGAAYPAVTMGAATTIATKHMPTGRQLESNICFRLHLSSITLEAIETIRNGRDLMLFLDVRGVIKGYAIDGPEPQNRAPHDPWAGHVLLDGGPSRIYRQQPAVQNLVLNVPQSDWIKHLATAGYQRTIVFEVAVPDTAVLGQAANHLKEAQEAFFQGRYADAASRCRDALDSVIRLQEIGQNSLFKAATSDPTRRQMTVEDTFGLAWASVRQITNTSHHRNGSKASFTRPMAQFVLGATALALNLAARERDIFTKPEKPAEPTSVQPKDSA